MERLMLILLIGIVAGWPTGLQAQQESLTYLMYANKAKVGKWTITRTQNGDETIFESERLVLFSIKLKAIRTFTAQRSVFRNGQLVRSEMKIEVDGEPRPNIATTWEDGTYAHRVEGEKTLRVPQPVTYASLDLFFRPPTPGTQVFFERTASLRPAHQIDENTFGITLENGEVNRYSYYEGRMVRAVLEDGILHTYVRLKKQRPANPEERQQRPAR